MLSSAWYDIVEYENSITEIDNFQFDMKTPPRVSKKRKKNIRGWYIFQFRQKCAVRKIENWYILMNLLN